MAGDDVFFHRGEHKILLGIFQRCGRVGEPVEAVAGVLFVPVVQEVVVEEGTPQEGVGVYGDVELVGQEQAETGHLDAVGEDSGGAVLDGRPCQRQPTGPVQVGDEGAEELTLFRGEFGFAHGRFLWNKVWYSDMRLSYEGGFAVSSIK